MTSRVPIWGPISVNTGETLKLMKAGAIEGGPYLAAGIAIANFDEVLGILDDLLLDVGSMLTSTSHDDFCDALQRCGDDIVRLATVIVGPVVSAGANAVEILIIELLRAKAPRLAALLSLGGAIVDDPGLGSSLDLAKLRDVLVGHPELVTEEFWDETFGTGDGGSRLVAVAVALLAVAPRTIGALRAGELGIAGLPAPPTSASGRQEWRDLRARTEGWIPVTFPLHVDDGGEFTISEFADLRGGFIPDLALSVLFRSQRREVGGRSVTDFEMWIDPSVDADAHELHSSAGTVARLEPGVRVGFGHDGTTGTWNAAVAPRAGSPVPATTDEAIVRLFLDSPDDQPDLLIGPPFDTRIVVRDLAAELRLDQVGEPSVELVATVEGFGVVLTNRWFRSLGFGGSTLREGLRFDLDLEARLSEEGGFSLQADGALEARFHVDWKFWIFTVHSLSVRVPVRADEDHFDVRAEVVAHWSAKAGPVTVIMDGAGGWIGWWSDQPGDEKHCIGLLPPTGVGLQLDFPGIAGGGFLDFTGGPNDRYGGVVTLRIGTPGSFSTLTVTAFGLHELTGSPNETDRRRSFVMVLGTTFRPGWPVGFGITIIGVGGMIGLHRRADSDALRERLTSGAVSNLLFAEDPVRDAPVLLGDLAAFFPPKLDTHVFGITLQLGWIPMTSVSNPGSQEYLVRLAVGVIAEIDPDNRLSKAVLLGSLRIAIPGAEKFLDIQVEAIGVLDFVRHRFEIDATVRRGTLLGIFKLTGDGGVRSSWGEPPYLAATLGGFHPDFHPDPAVFPKLARIKLAVDKNVLPTGVEISASAYFAITSNTIQFGGEFDASIKAGKWKVYGKIGGDALIRHPFAFDVEIRGKVGVTYRGHNIASVSFTGGLSGPNPLVLRGEVCVSVLLFDACWSDSFRLGGSGTLSRPVVSSVVPVLAAEISLPSNLTVDAEDSEVMIATDSESAATVLSPLATVTWAQHRVPLGLRIELFEDGKLDTPQRVGVSVEGSGTPFLDWFSPGSFLELSDAEQMALPAFERHPAGVVIDAPTSLRPTAVTVDVQYVEIRVPSPPIMVTGFDLPAYVSDQMVAVDAPSRIRPRPPRFAVFDEHFSVTNGAPVAASLTATAAHLAARTTGVATQQAADQLVTVPVA